MKIAILTLAHHQSDEFAVEITVDVYGDATRIPVAPRVGVDCWVPSCAIDMARVVANNLDADIKVDLQHGRSFVVAPYEDSTPT